MLDVQLWKLVIVQNIALMYLRFEHVHLFEKSTILNTILQVNLIVRGDWCKNLVVVTVADDSLRNCLLVHVVFHSQTVS